MRQLEPDLLVKGGDYTGREIAGSSTVLGRGGEVVTLPMIDGLSTTRLLAAATSRPSAMIADCNPRIAETMEDRT